jgi:hypothetical protein
MTLPQETSSSAERQERLLLEKLLLLDLIPDFSAHLSQMERHHRTPAA